MVIPSNPTITHQIQQSPRLAQGKNSGTATVCGSQVIHQKTLGEQAHDTDRTGTRPDKMKTKPRHPTMRSTKSVEKQTLNAKHNEKKNQL